MQKILNPAVNSYFERGGNSAYIRKVGVGEMRFSVLFLILLLFLRQGLGWPGTLPYFGLKLVGVPMLRSVS